MNTDLEQTLATAQLVTEILGQAQSAIGLYLTITSGYLLVAYLAGRDLTRLQVAIVTTLYAFFAITTTIAVVNYFASVTHFGHAYGDGRVPLWGGKVMGAILFCGVLACLKFMWDIRHPKTE